MQILVLLLASFTCNTFSPFFCNVFSFFSWLLCILTLDKFQSASNRSGHKFDNRVMNSDLRPRKAKYWPLKPRFWVSDPPKAPPKCSKKSKKTSEKKLKNNFFFVKTKHNMGSFHRRCQLANQLKLGMNMRLRYASTGGQKVKKPISYKYIFILLI